MSPTRATHWARRALRVPLFTKILVANGILLSAALATGLVAGDRVQIPATESAWIGSAVLIGGFLVLGAAVNAILLRIALAPVDGMTRAAHRLRAGDLSARAPITPLADPDVASACAAFNEALDALALYRHRLRRWSERSRRRDERERERLARELHEGIAQDLASILLHVQAARRDRGDEAGEGLAAAQERIVASIERIRVFARDGRADGLKEIGLGGAIESHVRERVRAGGPRIAVDASSLVPLDEASERVLYGVVREALENALRHGRPRRIDVVVGLVAGHARAVIRDDGIGFDPNAIASSSTGLFAIREEVTDLGGRLEIESARGRGTTIVASLPSRDPLRRAHVPYTARSQLPTT